MVLGDDLRAQRDALVADRDRRRRPTIDSTSARGLPQNEQRIDSADDGLGPWASSLMALG